MRCQFALFVLCICLQGNAETRYISDVLTVPLRSGPSNTHRILHRGLPSGTQLEVIEVDENSGFTHVLRQSGSDGWIPTQYLVSEPIAQAQLLKAQASIRELEHSMGEATATMSELSSAHDEERLQNTTLSGQIEALDRELMEIKSISANAIEEHRKARELERLNTQLRHEVNELVEERQQLQSNLQQRWMLIGAGLMLAGLAIGLVIKARPKRSGWS